MSRYGIDGLLEIEVNAGTRTTARKLLPFQAKKDGGYDDNKLLEQAATIARLPGGGAVVSFAPGSYTLARADVVAAARGNWPTVADQQKRDLGSFYAVELMSQLQRLTGAWRLAMRPDRPAQARGTRDAAKYFLCYEYAKKAGH